MKPIIQYSYCEIKLRKCIESLKYANTRLVTQHTCICTHSVGLI